MLDPHDALFRELGRRFYALQADEWGTDHIYQTDTRTANILIRGGP